MHQCQISKLNLEFFDIFHCKSKCKVWQIKLKHFDLNEHQHKVFDYNDAHDLYGGFLIENSWPLVGSILTPSGPFGFKNIVTLMIWTWK